MTVIGFLGAEAGATGATYEENTSGSMAISSAQAHSGQYSYEANPTGTNTGFLHVFTWPSGGGTTAATNVATLVGEFWFRYATKSTATTGEQVCVILNQSSSQKMELRLNSDGTLSIYDSSSTLVASTTFALAANTWVHIGLKSTTSSSASTYELRVNGITALSGTCTQTNSNARGLYLGKVANHNGTSVDYFYDDCVIDDTNFNGPTCSVIGLRPVADTATADWNAGTGSAPWYSQIASNPYDGTTTYIKNPATANKASQFRSDALDACTVLAVKPSMAFRLDTTGTATLKMRTISGATTDDSSSVTVNATLIQILAKLYTTDPNTSAAWYWDDVSKLTWGPIETAGVQMRVTDMLMQVLVRYNASPLTIQPATPVAQENGTPYADNPWFNGVSESAYGAVTPPSNPARDTRPWGVMSGDYGFSYRGPDGYVRICTGDTFADGWKGSFTAANGDASSTLSSSSNADISTMVGGAGDTITMAGSGSFVAGGGVGHVQRASDGRRLYFSYGSRSGSVLSHVKYLVASSAGSTVITAGDTVASPQNWRSQTLCRALVTDALNDGYDIVDFQPMSTDGGNVAQQLFTAPHAAQGTTMYATTQAISSMSSSGLEITVKFSAPHGVTRVGRFVRIAGAVPSGFNGDYVVGQIPDPQTIILGSFLAANTASTPGTAAFATFASPQAPTSTPSVTRVPSGGVVIPGGGVGGVDRDYLFTVNFGGSAGGLFMLSWTGLAYSDDLTQGFTLASDSSLLDPTATAAVSSYDVGGANHGGTLLLQTLALPSTGTNVIEVDTDTGYAYLSYTSRTSKTLNGVTLVRGTGNLMGGSSGARYACLGQYADYTSPHGLMFPWRHTDGYVYLMSIMGYRVGQTFVSRVPQGSLLDISAYTFWDGATWNTDKTKAKPVYGNVGSLGFATQGISESSFLYHAGVGLWVSTYTCADGNLYMRTAPNPQGPWSPATAIIAAGTYTSTFYGGYVHAMSGQPPNESNKLYFHISMTDPYCVVLHASQMDANIPGHLPERVKTQAVARASRW